MYSTQDTMEFDPEMETFEEEMEAFGESEWSDETAEVFDEQELTDLAAELLGITNEEELNYFLGSLIKKASRAIGKVVRSPVGKAIGGVLKTAAKKALPLAGAAVGTYFGGPLGAKIGSGLAKAASGALGLESEMMSQEDEQYEGAKQFVRLAGQTVKSTLAAPAGRDPRSAAQAAAIKAAKVLAPGLLGASSATRHRRATAGQWVRRGRNIIVKNI